MANPAPLAPASQWRLEFAQELSTFYSPNEHIKMIVIGGSTARGQADAYSDLDIVVYWDVLDLPWLKTPPLAPLGFERTMLRKMGPEEVYLESYHFGALKADFGHLTLDLWTALADDVLVKHNPDPESLKTLGGFLEAKPLHGAELFEQWRQRIAQFPDELGLAMVRSNLRFFQKGCLLHQGLERGDILYYYDGLCTSLKNLLGVLAGLNKVYFSSAEPRWLEFELARMPIQPPRTLERINALFEMDRAKALEKLEVLIDEVLTLVEKHRPDHDLSRLRRMSAIRVQACEAKPALPPHP